MTQTRRSFMARSLALGCSAAASPLITTVTLAAAPGDHRLVVVILRGGMDGLDVLRPIGDPDFGRLRPTLATGAATPIDGRFALHPELLDLLPLWQSGELAFAHAVSTPYRDKRSHFEGQDALENGGPDPAGGLTSGRDGWLNRAMSRLPETKSETAFAVGRERLLLLSGSKPVSMWSPEATLDLSPQAEMLLERIYAHDPLFHEAAMKAIQLSEAVGGPMTGGRQATRAKALAAFSAARLLEESRIACFSIGGWDTHANQQRMLPRALGELRDAILTLRSDLGSVWDRTVVLCLTEFGRTVRENGSRGTDHGTAGAAIFAGGALAGKAVHTQWPGLSDDALYQGRDLMPTRDIRSFAAWALAGLFSLRRNDLESMVFPGLEMGKDPRLIA